MLLLQFICGTDTQYPKCDCIWKKKSFDKYNKIKMKLHEWAFTQVPSVLPRRGDEDQLTQSNDPVKRKGEDGELQDQERGLRRNQT